MNLESSSRLVKLRALSSAWRQVQLAAIDLDDIELAQRARDEGVLVLRMIGEVVTGKWECAS